jgi:hypothetical protein
VNAFVASHKVKVRICILQRESRGICLWVLATAPFQRRRRRRRLASNSKLRVHSSARQCRSNFSIRRELRLRSDAALALCFRPGLPSFHHSSIDLPIRHPSLQLRWSNSGRLAGTSCQAAGILPSETAKEVCSKISLHLHVLHVPVSVGGEAEKECHTLRVWMCW